MSEQVTCQCGAAVWNGVAGWEICTQRNAHEDGCWDVSVEDGYCFMCGAKLDVDGLATPMVAAVTSEAVRATEFWQALKRLCKVGDDGLDVEGGLTDNEAEVMYGLWRSGLAEWLEVGMKRCDDPLEPPEPIYAVYPTATGRIIHAALAATGAQVPGEADHD